MLKRTKGRLLLTLLVVTGMAGTVNNSALTGKERKFAVSQLKDTRNEFFQSIRGLSEKQLNYRPDPAGRTIRECIYHMAMTEAAAWQLMESTMRQPAMPEKRSKANLRDLQLLETSQNDGSNFQFASSIQVTKAPWQNTAAATLAFKNMRASHLKYIRSTTEDLRNHFTQLSGNWIDGYQLLLIMAGNSDRLVRQIEAIKSGPGFPND